MSSFAVKLRYFLNEYNLKQNDLAKMTGINKSSISEYLSGNYQPKYKNILKIAQALHMSPDVFLEKPQSVKQIPLLGKIAAGRKRRFQHKLGGSLSDHRTHSFELKYPAMASAIYSQA